MEMRMSLHTKPFMAIRSGIKTVEIRLNDYKRQLLTIGDTIVFTHAGDETEKVRVTVKNLLVKQTFLELIESIPAAELGHLGSIDVQKFANSMYTIYTPEQEKEHGVLGIKIELA